MTSELKRSGHPMLAAFLTVSVGTFAQTEPPDPVDTIPPMKSEELELLKEEETVSIVGRYEQPISETPSNVCVSTDEDIRQSGAVDLPTVLRRIPGIEVMQTTGADFNVSARGDNQLLANKMLVLVDGRSIYLDGQGVVYWKMIPVTLPEIKRIEVLKGPASAVYGFNAFDGVINIITESPGEMKGTTGVRYDLDTFIHPTVSPRAAVLYRLSPDHMVRIGVSVAYRPPTLVEASFDSLAITTLPPPIPSPPQYRAQGRMGERAQRRGPLPSLWVRHVSYQPSLLHIRAVRSAAGRSSRRELQPPEHARRLSILATESGGRLHAGRGGRGLVFNALNDKHKEHPLGDTISRRVMGWITMKF
jgi:outer membrane receptor protein involved in Fe transport